MEGGREGQGNTSTLHFLHLALSLSTVYRHNTKKENNYSKKIKCLKAKELPIAWHGGRERE